MSCQTADQLLSALLEDELSAADHSRLTALLHDDGEMRDRAVQLLITDVLLTDAYPSQRVQDSEFRVQEKPVPLMRPSRPVGLKAGFALAAAAVVTLSVSAWFFFSSESQTVRPEPTTVSRSVAMISDLNGARFAESSMPTALGSELGPGTLALKSGTAQVMFKSGAVVEMTGPCTLEMINPGRGYLRHGTVSAYVPDQAVGFILDTPRSVRVIDMGTAFRLSVSDTGQTDLTVTEGSVWLDVSGPDDGKSLSRIVSAYDTVRIASDRRSVMRGQARTLHSSGVGVEPGQLDPKWQVRTAGEEQSRPALVMPTPDARYARPANPQARWISVPDAGGMAAGSTRYTFTTMIDLNGLDVSTAHVFGTCAADNHITAIRVNGHPIDLPAMDAEEGYVQLHPFVLHRNLTPGVNKVTFEVYNNPGDTYNPMGLLVDWSVLALPDERSGQRIKVE